MMHNLATTITKSCFAEVMLPDQGPVQIDQYTLSNGFMSVDIINYGSTITSIKLPDNYGTLSDIVLGFDDIDGYMSDKNPYFGCTVGRVANRISGASYEHDGFKYFLSKNCGPNTLHGGISGFNKKIWNAEIVNHNSLWMTYCSPHLEEGFPGDLEVCTKYTLTHDNYLVVRICASTNKITPVNMTNHSYFNLAGHETGAKGLFSHKLKINANKYTELDPESLTPTGAILPVRNTLYDITKFTSVGELIKKSENKGIDINYCFAKDSLKTIARLAHAPSGRSLQLYSSHPGVQLYTSNGVENISGKEGVVYEKFGALCLEPQGYPDAVNQKQFPSIWLHPKDIYEHLIVYKFRVEKLADSDSEQQKEDDTEKSVEVKSSKSLLKKGRSSGKLSSGRDESHKKYRMKRRKS
ncbi:galactose mutarotase-like isoform X2 [Rhodnius prolixus]